MTDIERQPFPMPATPDARRHGCSCPDFDPEREKAGEPQFANWFCPLHGMAALEEHSKGARLAFLAHRTPGTGNRLEPKDGASTPAAKNHQNETRDRFLRGDVGLVRRYPRILGR